MSLLHNMSAPPRSQVVVAPGFVAAPQAVVSAHDWLPRGNDFARRLCAALGFEAGVNPETTLGEQVDAWLEAHRVPRAVVLLPPAEGDRLGRLGAVAILSRASGACFLRDRLPRFDRASLSRRVGIACPLPWTTG